MKTYNDEHVLREYVEKNWDYYATEFEMRCIRLGILREKAAGQVRVSIRGKLQHIGEDSWRSEWNFEVEQALVVGVKVYHRGIVDRVLANCRSGSAWVNRCPVCNRIARTALAQQCRWCGHCWRVSS